MVYSMEPGVAAQTAGISTSESGAGAFVRRIVMHAVFGVFERQGCAAGLPNPLIEIILDQLTVNINYQPIQFQRASVNPMAAANIPGMSMMNICIIVGSTVTSLCAPTMANDLDSVLNTGAKIISIPARHYKFKNSHDHARCHGELVERDVARRGEQSDSNPGIGSVWIELLLGICHRLMKLELDGELLPMDNPFMRLFKSLPYERNKLVNHIAVQ